ncbi:MAG: CYTH domain-containing protein [Mogibacterium diversum]|uniref:CYTH domain-containing protein n=1 Tax=Mogibacterium diversum TaxID=114527 RepID=A0A930ECP1_9FIRM|nr:CYTH domain-containing protein [Mogibacterium diversum]
METEFKFCIDDTSLVDKIINDSMLDDYVDRNALEVIDMKAVYFDTDDLDLRKAGIAYRVRYENDRITATVKWDNKVEDGLHSREEFNLVINDERFAMEPDIEAFK